MVWVYGERNWWLSKNDNKRKTQRMAESRKMRNPRDQERCSQDLLK